VNPELEAIRDAWDAGSDGGRDEDLARQRADAYVTAHGDEFTDVEGLSVEECVGRIDTYRLGDQREQVQRIETWLLHLRAGQPIVGRLG
jgi:hypothetical protein